MHCKTIIKTKNTTKTFFSETDFWTAIKKIDQSIVKANERQG